MAFQFDRYLFASDSGIDSLSVHKAYEEWASYCYIGLSMCSGSRPAAIPLSTNRAAPADPGASYDGARVGGDPEASAAVEKIQKTSNRRDECFDAGKAKVARSMRAQGDRERSGDMGENRGTSRPGGCEFGKRLSWIQENKVGGRVRSGPALGLSGLKCQGHTNGVTGSARYATETFPQCATRNAARTGSVPDGVDGGCRTFAECFTDVRNGAVSGEPIAATSSASALRAIDDVIEECSSSEESSGEESGSQSGSQSGWRAPPEAPRRRWVTFADERGVDLVTCRVFERDRSPATSGSAPDSSDSSDDDDDGLDADADMTSSSSAGKRFTILADDSYKLMKRDIDNVKKLIAKHRHYFDNLRPDDDVIGGGGAPTATADDLVSTPAGGSTSPSSDADGKEDGGCDGESPHDPLPVVSGDNDDGRRRCNFINFDLPRSDEEAVSSAVKLRQLLFSQETGCLSGHVIGRRASEGMRLFVRYTTDHWRTQDDVTGSRVAGCFQSRTDHGSELFHFRLPLDTSHVSLEHSQGAALVELAVCYHAPDTRTEFWDNNGGQNYKIEIYI